MDIGYVEWEQRVYNLKLKITKNRGSLTPDMLFELINLIELLKILNKGGGDSSIINPTPPLPPPNVTDEPDDEDEDEEVDPDELTAEKVRDLLSTLQGDERLDAKYIKNIAENTYVDVSGIPMPLLTFLKFLLDEINKTKQKLTREEIIRLIGFEPFNSENVVDNLDDPRSDTVLNTEALVEELDKIKPETLIIDFTNVMEVDTNHDFDRIYDVEVFVDGNRVYTYVDVSTPKKVVVKFCENATGYLILKKLKIDE